MKQVTLEVLETKHKEFGEMIAKFKAEIKTAFFLPESHIELAHGEHYAGVILGKEGESSYHLILLPEDKEPGKWQEAMDWAKSIGGELPTRREQSLLFANLKEEFQRAWYWSGAQHASDAGYAWSQGFGNGSQDGWGESTSHRARAVRRLVIE
jgi:hypothetical protein